MNTDQPQLKNARNAFLWVAIIVLALAPFPWGW
jgi:hypothetical protein